MQSRSVTHGTAPLCWLGSRGLVAGCCEHCAEPSGDGAAAETRVLNKGRVARVLLFASWNRELSMEFGFSDAEASGSLIRKVVAYDLPVGASCASYLSRYGI
jgi:hypothetical protein